MYEEPRQATTLHEIRDFLAAQAVGPAPWSPARSAVDALYALLRERRGDPGFWAALETLVARLQDARVRPEVIRGSDVLGHATTAELLAALRDALPAKDDGPGEARAWARTTSEARALAAFLLLGTAVACTPQLGDDDDDDDTTEATGCPEAPQGLSDHNTDVYCELVDIVRNADVPTWTRDDVLDCLPSLSSAYREELLEMFREYSDSQLANALSELADDCYPPGDDDAEH